MPLRIWDGVPKTRNPKSALARGATSQLSDVHVFPMHLWISFMSIGMYYFLHSMQHQSCIYAAWMPVELMLASSRENAFIGVMYSQNYSLHAYYLLPNIQSYLHAMLARCLIPTFSPSKEVSLHALDMHSLLEEELWSGNQPVGPSSCLPARCCHCFHSPRKLQQLEECWNTSVQVARTVRIQAEPHARTYQVWHAALCSLRNTRTGTLKVCCIWTEPSCRKRLFPLR